MYSMVVAFRHKIVGNINESEAMSAVCGSVK